MDATIIVAIIGGTATVTAAAIKIVPLLLPKPPTPEPPPPQSPGIQYAFHVECLQFTVTFDDTGSGDANRLVTGLRATQTIHNLEVPIQVNLTTSVPNGKVFPAKVSETEGSALAVESLTPPSGDVLSPETHVTVLGQISRETGPVSFEVLQKFERAFFMARADVKDAYKKDTIKTEYTAVSVPVPADRIIVEVNFPPAFDGKDLVVGQVAFNLIGKTEVINDEQTQRISGGAVYDRGKRRALLKVVNPIPGVNYGVTWLPPSA